MNFILLVTSGWFLCARCSTYHWATWWSYGTFQTIQTCSSEGHKGTISVVWCYISCTYYCWFYNLFPAFCGHRNVTVMFWELLLNWNFLWMLMPTIYKELVVWLEQLIHFQPENKQKKSLSLWWNLIKRYKNITILLVYIIRNIYQTPNNKNCNIYIYIFLAAYRLITLTSGKNQIRPVCPWTFSFFTELWKWGLNFGALITN